MDEIDRLLRLLDFEIEKLRSEDKQPGWTIWALLGSLATIIWLLLRQFPQNNLSWPNIFSLVLFVSICLDTITFLYKVCLVNEETSPIEPRFGYTKTLFSTKRALGLLEFLRIIILLVILYFTAMPKLYSLPLWFLYSSSAALSLIFLILTFFRLPISLSPNLHLCSKVSIVIIFVGLPTLGLVGLSKELFMKNSLPTIPEWRIAGLLFAIMSLLSLLAKTQQQSHLLPILLNLRRDLVLEKIDIASAKQQIDIALTGLRVDHIFQEDVSKVLWHLNERNIAYKHISDQLKLVEKMLSRIEDNTAKEDDLTVARSLKDSIKSNLVRANTARKSEKNTAEKIYKRFKFLELANPAIRNDLKSIQEKITCAVAPVDFLFNEIKSQGEKILSKCEVNTSK